MVDSIPCVETSCQDHLVDTFSYRAEDIPYSIRPVNNSIMKKGSFPSRSRPKKKERVYITNIHLPVPKSSVERGVSQKNKTKKKAGGNRDRP